MGEWNKRPHGSRKSPGKMADRRIHCDYQIEVSYHGGRVAKILQERTCIKERSCRIRTHSIAKRFHFASRPILLETDNRKSRNIEKFCKLSSRHRTFAVTIVS